MKETIEDIFQNLEKISQSDAVIDLKIIEKTKSILKATIEEFTEEAFFIASEKLKII